MFSTDTPIPEPGMDSCRTDARDPGRDPLHARPLETEATHCGGVQRVHTSVPVHTGGCVCVCVVSEGLSEWVNE